MGQAGSTHNARRQDDIVQEKNTFPCREDTTLDRSELLRSRQYGRLFLFAAMHEMLLVIDGVDGLFGASG